MYVIDCLKWVKLINASHWMFEMSEIDMRMSLVVSKGLDQCVHRKYVCN